MDTVEFSMSDYLNDLGAPDAPIESPSDTENIQYTIMESFSD